MFFDLRLDDNFHSLSGKCLVATPHGGLNNMFDKSLIYIASHTKNGAVGLIVNHLINKIPLKTIMKMLKDDTSDVMDINFNIYLGGPIEPERGFILHSSNDYDEKNILFRFGDNLAISTNVQILKDIAAKVGPSKSLFVMGYTGWDAGQLEGEMMNNFWMIVDAHGDVILELVFADLQNEEKWRRALEIIGIKDTIFSSQVGKA